MCWVKFHVFYPHSALQIPNSGSSAATGERAKSGKPPALTLLEMHQEAERILKQQRVQQQRDRVRTGEDVHIKTY